MSAEPTTPASPEPRTSTARACWQLVVNEPVAYAWSWLQWVAFHLSPLAIGYVVKLTLDRLTDDATGIPMLLLGAILGLETARWMLLVSAAFQWHGAWIGWLTVPRVNLLRSLVTGGGPVDGRLPGSPGEAVSRFRDDTQDVGTVLDIWLDISGAVLSTLIGLAVIASIDPRAAVAVSIPVAIALGISTVFGPVLRRWRRAARQSTAAVTSFIGDTFGAILAVKTNGAESAVDRRFAELNAIRARASRRDEVGSEFVRTLGYGTAEIAVGVVLLAVASAFSTGTITIGDLALLTSYVGIVAGLPKWAARLGVYTRQADVSLDRLAELGVGGTRREVTSPTTTHLRHGPPPLPAPDRHERSFASLDASGLTVRHESGRGIDSVDLTVRAAELVVITGPVGSGKTTLLRALLGLVAVEAGTVRWNGVVVDPATELVPPRVAYLPQVPRLFSEPLADTVLLGLAGDDLDAALRTACLEDDLASMAAGVQTVVGPKGVRLSGGQIQRTAAARAFVRRPEVLVVDDLSSALDVDTEHRVWERLLADRPPAAVLVSHRPSVLALADRVVTLDEGRVVDVS